MKRRGSEQPYDDVLADVSAIIARVSGVQPGKIRPESQLREHLGISGDDGDEVFEEIDRIYEVDWAGLDLGVHFGNEASVPLLPWTIKGNCSAFEAQPLTAAQLAGAVHVGRWHGSPLVPVTPGKLRRMQAWSWLFWSPVFAVLALLLLKFVWDIVDG